MSWPSVIFVWRTFRYRLVVARMFAGTKRVHATLSWQRVGKGSTKPSRSPYSSSKGGMVQYVAHGQMDWVDGVTRAETMFAYWIIHPGPWDDATGHLLGCDGPVARQCWWWGLPSCHGESNGGIRAHCCRPRWTGPTFDRPCSPNVQELRACGKACRTRIYYWTHAVLLNEEVSCEREYKLIQHFPTNTFSAEHVYKPIFTFSSLLVFSWLHMC